MKTKKVLALVVLAALLISIMPFAALADISPYNTKIEEPDGSAETTIYYQATTTGLTSADFQNKEEGNTFGISFVSTTPDNAGNPAGGANLYMASNRLANDRFFYSTDDDGPWYLIDDSSTAAAYGTAIYTMAVPSGAGMLYIHVESATPGKASVVFGVEAESVALYNKGADFSSTSSITNIIGQTKYAIEFIAADADKVTISSNYDASSPKYANGVDTYTITAFVYTNGIPASGKDVTFSILSGSGGVLTQTRVTSSISGKAETKIYSTRAETFEIQAKVNTKAYAVLTDDTTRTNYATPAVKFRDTGIVSLKAESDNNQKVARNATSDKKFNFSAYDAAGNRVDFSKLTTSANMTTYIKNASGVGMQVEIVSKPTGAALAKDDIKFDIHSSGNGQIVVPISKINKDGDYEIKIYLPNGVSVSYKFNAKDQGDITKMILSYGSSSYSGGTVLPRPEIKYEDAEGYQTTEDLTITSNLKLSISDASFMDGSMTKYGQFKLKDDKSGVVTMTVVNNDKNLVGTQKLNVEKPASYLKLTPQSVGAVGGEVNVAIELVDVDGKLAAAGIGIGATAPSGSPVVITKGQANATIIAKPEGAISSASVVDTSDLKKGKASVKVSSNVEGEVTLQVIITEDGFSKVDSPADEALPAYGGRTYTGACTVSFGKASTGGGQIIFIVGSSSYVSGNKVYAAESPSFIENDRTFLGVRDMGNSIGATIDWDPDSNTASLSKDGITVKVTVGAKKITVTKNGVTTEIEIDAAAQNKNGRVYLPFRAVLEAFNYAVSFDQATNSIVCTL